MSFCMWLSAVPCGCRIKQDLLTGQASAVYIFNEDSRSFLQTATQSGKTFTFLKAVLILPQEQTSSVVPSSVSSATGFLSTDPSQPVIVKLTTKVRPADTPASYHARSSAHLFVYTGGISRSPVTDTDERQGMKPVGASAWVK